PCNARSRALPYPLSLHDALPISPHRGRVADLVRRQGEGGNRRRGVGELVDLAGREQYKQYKERSAGNNAHDPPSWGQGPAPSARSEEHTSELQSRFDLVCRLLLE